jgi:1,4-dihydroxy-2-naphthoate octaprenyltransferase
MTGTDLIRALRLPFLTVSLMPYVFGALIPGASFHVGRFLAGFLAVGFAHLAANLANDYGDAKTGADDQDITYYGFFGGSKLIQEGKVKPVFFAHGAILCACIAFFSGIYGIFMTQSWSLVWLLAGGLFLGIAYSLPPLRLSYHRLGEVAVFLLFGPVCVVAGGAFQEQAANNGALWLLSLPFGFLATSVLVANEVPDAVTDLNTGKNTLVNTMGAAKGYQFYLTLSFGALLTIIALAMIQLLHALTLLALCTLPLAWKASGILKNHFHEKATLVNASKLAVNVHTQTGIILIIGAAL